MTFDEVMAKFSGKWDDQGRAVIVGSDGYHWCIATKSGAEVTLTNDGNRYVTPATPEQKAPDAPKRGGKGKKADPDPVPPVVDEVEE